MGDLMRDFNAVGKERDILRWEQTSSAPCAVPKVLLTICCRRDEQCCRWEVREDLSESLAHNSRVCTYAFCTERDYGFVRRVRVEARAGATREHALRLLVSLLCSCGRRPCCTAQLR